MRLRRIRVDASGAEIESTFLSIEWNTGFGILQAAPNGYFLATYGANIALGPEI